MWTSLGVPSDAALFVRLIECYSEPHRHYHTMQHIEECFTLLESLRSNADRPHEIAIALWFHDAIYDTKRKDSEDRCAQWAREVLLAKQLASAVVGRVSQLILVTKHAASPTGRDAAVLVDIDLAILGAPQSRFDEYEIQVGKEYAWVPSILYRHERRKVLEELLVVRSYIRQSSFVTVVSKRLATTSQDRCNACSEGVE